MTGSHPRAVLIEAGDATCEIWPEIGGSIANWWIGQQPMFRAATAGDSPINALQMASFPLVPYSNRIGFARFDWAGRSLEIERNFPPEPHAIHGTGWTSPWQVHQDSPSEAILRLNHNANASWPWSFAAEQRIVLSETTLTISMSVTNMSTELVPLAFGHHPYFDADGASLQFNAAKFWVSGANGLPSRPETPDGERSFARMSPVEGRSLDNGYAGWDGVARIEWRDRPWALRIEADMEAAVVYIPSGGDFFCFEPVPHIINALNLPEHQPRMPLVAPGSRYAGAIRFSAQSR